MDNLISRNDAYNTLTEYYHHTTEIQHNALREALERVPDVQPCEDTISRKAAIDLFPNDDLEWDTKGGYIAPHLARQMISELPSTQPETHEERTETHGVCLDTIDRQAAIDVLSLGKEILSRVLDDIDVVGTDREKYSWGLGLIESYINDIEELPSAQQRWIPCSERLPKQPNPNPELEGKPLDIYLVCKQGNIPFRAFWNGRNFADGWTTLDVDAWMPLPEPYREGE